jgi:hypothetical protein
VQSPESRWLNVTAAFLADTVQPLRETLERLIDGTELVDGGVVDSLQCFVVLQLNRPIGGVADQRVEPPLQIVLDALMALH